MKEIDIPPFRVSYRSSPALLCSLYPQSVGGEANLLVPATAVPCHRDVSGKLAILC